MEVDGLERSFSYVEQDGEWKNRKINFVTVLKNFVSQLKPGQDMTKFSIPAEICHPYGLLELIGVRELSMFHLLFEVNIAPSPIERFFAVLKFFFGTVRSEVMEKKPWNPVLGEQHVIYADHPSKNKNARSFFVAEQVSHHPPISAVFLNSSVEQIRFNANVGFEIKFGGNYVNVRTAGPLWISADRFHETYRLNKCFPDMVIKNVVWGKKYIMWDGEVLIHCKDTGLRAYIRYTEKNKTNLVSAYLLANNKKEPLYEFEGVAGKEIYYCPSGYKNKKLFVNLEAVSRSKIHYLPIAKLPANSSFMIWRDVNEAILRNDIQHAENEKKIIEQMQREKYKLSECDGGSGFTSKYFVLDPLTKEWNFNNGSINLDEILGIEMTQEDVRDIDDNSKGNNDIDDNSKGNNDIDENAMGQEEFEDSANNSNTRDILVSDETAGRGGQEVVRCREVVDTGAISGNEDIARDGIHQGGVAIGTEKKGSGINKIKHIYGAAMGDSTKKELRAVKKKAREEQKQLLRQVKVKRKMSETGGIQQILESGEIMKGYVKVRNSFKKWRERWLVLQHGRLIYYKRPEDVSRLSCLSLVNLIGCDVWWRPSKKHGSCFKVYSLNQYPIFSKTGLKGETLSTAFLPVSTDHIIMRVDSEELASKWIEQIRKAIPDWKQNKTLILATRMQESDSESEYDESEEIDQLGPSKGDCVNGTTCTTANEDNPRNDAGEEVSLKMLKYLKKITTLQKKISNNTGRHLVSVIDQLEKIHAQLADSEETFKNPFEKRTDTSEDYQLFAIHHFKSKRYLLLAFVLLLPFFCYYFF